VGQSRAARRGEVARCRKRGEALVDGARISATWAKQLLDGSDACGVVLGVVTVAGIFSGFLTPDRHGFGMLIFGQVIWFLIVAAGLWRLGPEAAVE
jgi:hypothetical protein